MHSRPFRWLLISVKTWAFRESGKETTSRRLLKVSYVQKLVSEVSETFRKKTKIMDYCLAESSRNLYCMHFLKKNRIKQNDVILNLTPENRL